MLETIFILFCLWVYQYIGRLHFKMRYVSSEYEKTRVSIPNTPRLWMFLLSKISRGRLYWLLGTSPGGVWHYGKWNDKKYRKWIIKEYQEIWIWPAIEGERIYKNIAFRVSDHYHIIFRTQQKKYLRESMFSELREEVKKYLKGFKIVGAESTSYRYRIYLRLPQNPIDFLGPWFEPSKKQKPYGHPGDICKFQSDASKKLNAILVLPHSRNAQKTREIIVEVGEGNFCDINGWSFQQNKWEEWKNEFIKFFQDINNFHKTSIVV